MARPFVWRTLGIIGQDRSHELKMEFRRNLQNARHRRPFRACGD